MVVMIGGREDSNSRGLVENCSYCSVPTSSTAVSPLPKNWLISKMAVKGLMYRAE